MKVIVIQQKMIGDVLTSTILFEALRQKYPDAQLDYLINEHTYPVVKNNPYIDNFVLLTREIEKKYSKLYSFIKQIKKNKYDVVIDAYGKLSSNLITLFSASKIKISYHKKYTSFIYNENINRLKKPEHNLSLAIENRMRLLTPLQIPFGDFKPKILLTKQEIDNTRNTLKSFKIKPKKPLYMISVLGSCQKKTYPAKYMAKLLDYIVLNQPSAQLLFNYIPEQIKEAKEIYSSCSLTTQKQIFFELYATSIREFLALTSHCDGLIGNEGGAINIAKALKKPTFIIFNPGLNKSNWFGNKENNKNSAVHLSDFINYSIEDYYAAKQNPNTYYLKFKPKFIKPKLAEFLSKN